MTDVAVLPDDRVVTREGDHLVIRSPSNPAHWWGNYLLFDDAPRRGDGERWEALFVEAFPELGVAGHRAYAWDRTDGAEGEAQREFVSDGFQLQRDVGLTATPDAIRPHRRANREIEIRALDPHPDADRELWEGAIAVQLADNASDDDPILDFESYARARMHDLQVLFAAGRGAWYVALDPDDEVVAGCGVVAIGRLGRFQAVDTAPPHRRRGICRRLVTEAAAHASRAHDLDTLVIVAEAGYHALGIYESLGFSACEQTRGLSRAPHRPQRFSPAVRRGSAELMPEPKQSDRGDQGLPGQVGENGEEGGPVQPHTEKDADGGDENAGGESKEGSQSTGSPDSAG